MKPAVPLSAMILIILIFKLHTNLAVPPNTIQNIRKVLTLFQNYQRGYNYFTKNKFWNRNKDPNGVDNTMYQERCYIHFQAKYGRNFTELHSIFISQILALIYAWKFKQRESRLRISHPQKYDFPESLIYNIFADYGTQSEPVIPVILKIIELKHPESFEEFVVVSFAFYEFRFKVQQLIAEKRIDLEIVDSEFKTELRKKAEVLITYIKKTLLRNNLLNNGDIKNKVEYILSAGKIILSFCLRPTLARIKSQEGKLQKIPKNSMTGFGIDVLSNLNLALNTESFIELSRRVPNMLSTNYDSGREDMVKSVVIDMMELLIFEIASSINKQTGEEARKDIKSFILVQPSKDEPSTLIIAEIPYDLLGSYFPKPDTVHWSTYVSNWVYDNFPFK